MSNAASFIKLCEQVIADYEAGTYSLHKAAAMINSSPCEYPFDGPAHPMVYEVSDIAFNIAEDYRSEVADNADWVVLKKTVYDYIAGNWAPTCWILTIMYGEYLEHTLIHSLSITVRRQNGTTIIETATPDIARVMNEIIQTLDAQQTDERYLQNLSVLVPIDIGKYKRMSVEAEEYLM